MLVYLDWNVFSDMNKIGKQKLSPEDEKTYQAIRTMIDDNVIQVIYSNAHINDIMRGYKKDPSFISGDMEIIRRLTNNLCIVQYWGNNDVTIHYRDVEEFFNTAKNDFSIIDKSFEELLQTITAPLGMVGVSLTANLRNLLSVQVPNMSQVYKYDPIFSKIFPLAKQNPTILSLSEDLYNLYKVMLKDYSIYRELKNYINRSKVTLKNQAKFLNSMDKTLSEAPKQLTWNEAWDKGWNDALSKQKTSKNQAYHKIMTTYQKINFEGIKADEYFANMVDDALHVFYGAHFPYFVTRDDRCHYKAIETYKQLKIDTIVLKPHEFVSKFSAE